MTGTRQRAKRPRPGWWARNRDLGVLAIFAGVIVFTGISPPEG